MSKLASDESSTENICFRLRAWLVWCTEFSRRSTAADDYSGTVDISSRSCRRCPGRSQAEMFIVCPGPVAALYMLPSLPFALPVELTLEVKQRSVWKQAPGI